MKYCSQCFRQFDDGSVFCPRCGIPLVEAAPVAEEIPAAVEEIAAPVAEEVSTGVEENSTVVGEVPAPVAVLERAPADKAGTSAAEPASEAEAPVAEPAVTGAAPAAPEKKRKEAPRVEPKIGFFRHILSFLLCLLLLVFLLVPTLVYELRDTTTERWIGTFLEKVEVSDYVDTGVLSAGIENWLYDLVPGADRFARADMSGVAEGVEAFLEGSTLKPFLAAQAGTFFDDVYAGRSTELLTAADFDAFLTENSNLFNERMNGLIQELFGKAVNIEFRLSDAQRAAFAEVLAQMLDYSGVRPYLSADGLRSAAPEAYYGLRFGLSWVTLGVSLTLTALVFLLLIKVLKSGTRAVKRLGVVLVIIGLCLTLAALFPMILPETWLSLFGGEALYALLVGEFLRTHLVLVDLILLGLGILLIVIVALVRGGRRRRLARAETV